MYLLVPSFRASPETNRSTSKNKFTIEIVGGVGQKLTHAQASASNVACHLQYLLGNRRYGLNTHFGLHKIIVSEHVSFVTHVQWMEPFEE